MPAMNFVCLNGHPVTLGKACDVCGSGVALDAEVSRPEAMSDIPGMSGIESIMRPLLEKVMSRPESEPVTRLERLICALIASNPLPRDPLVSVLVNCAREIERAMDAPPFRKVGESHATWTREAFTQECGRQLFKMANFHQENSNAVAQELARVFYGE